MKTDKENILIVGHIGAGRLLAAEILALKGNKDVIIIQDGKVVQGNPFPERPVPPVFKIENTYMQSDGYKNLEYSPTSFKPSKHHNSSCGPSAKKAKNKRAQQRKSRKINRRK